MPSIKALSYVLLSGILIYLILYSLILRKLLVVRIYFEDRTQSQYSAPLQEGNAFKLSLSTNERDISHFVSKESSFPSKQEQSQNLRDLIRTEKREFSEEIWSFLKQLGVEVKKASNFFEISQTKPPVRVNSNGALLSALMKKMDNFVNFSIDERCPTSHLREVGLLAINNSTVNLEDLQQELYFVSNGGRWTPSCQSRQKVAIIVPFRDRQNHLYIFLRHMHPFLRWQLLDYRIFVIEQADNEPFNRGMLMNVGFTEAMKVDNFSCIIFHDVDLLPEDVRNDYSCPSSPRHMSTAVDIMEYKLKYKTLFGGVEGFRVEHYQEVNGFPNRFWGWGGEDDDLYARIMKKQLSLTRPAQMIGRYTMLHHVHSDDDANPQRFEELKKSEALSEHDGLNTLTYIVVDYREMPLYTFLSLSLRQS